MMTLLFFKFESCNNQHMYAQSDETLLQLMVVSDVVEALPFSWAWVNTDLLALYFILLGSRIWLLFSATLSLFLRSVIKCYHLLVRVIGMALSTHYLFKVTAFGMWTCWQDTRSMLSQVGLTVNYLGTWVSDDVVNLYVGSLDNSNSEAIRNPPAQANRAGASSEVRYFYLQDKVTHSEVKIVGPSARRWWLDSTSSQCCQIFQVQNTKTGKIYQITMNYTNCP
jgi:hypothetical protein